MNREIFMNAVHSFERMFQCSLTLHDYSGLLTFGLLPHLHLNPFCPRIKESARNNESDCVLFDSTAVQMELLKCDGPLFKQCPAGFIECVFPVKTDRKLSGAIFAGPFSNAELPPFPVLFSKEKFPGNPVSSTELPDLPSDLESFLSFGVMLASMLDYVSQGRQRYPENVKELIEDFINRKYNLNIGLADIAELLSLTPSRASNRVKKEFGKGFSTLLNERRILTACRFLEKTGFSIENIAVRSGFRDGPYFHRIFHRTMGMTPLEYRRKNQKYST